MKGLTPRQLLEITEFIQKHHEFGYVTEENRIKGEYGYCIKYIDACYDSRQGDYWAISFRGMGKITFTTNAFGILNERPKDCTFTSLYDWIMAFLNYDWKPEGKQYSFMHGDQEGPLHNSFPNGKIEKEWSDLDMINAYCGDLEGGATTEDLADACKWITSYRIKTQKNQTEALRFSESDMFKAMNTVNKAEVPFDFRQWVQDYGLEKQKSWS